MKAIRASSSPNLLPPSMSTEYLHDNSLEGVTANVRLLLKLIQDHNTACAKENNDSRRMLRVAGMMTILDNVRNRIQKCQSFGMKREAELRRCNSDVRLTSDAPRDKRPCELVADEKQKLRKELNASLAARKSLEVMCSSLGKEKEIMALEITRKVHELSGMEELVNDLKAQNEMLLAKVKEYASEQHKEKRPRGGEVQGNAALLERNKALSQQLLRSLEGYKSMKRKLKDTQEENMAMRDTMTEIVVDVGNSIEKIHSLKQQAASGSENPVDADDEIRELEHMFQSLQMKVSEHWQKNSECVKL